jgi:tyrosinase
MWSLYRAGGWAKYIVWHNGFMGAAHRGSAFLPWHRYFILSMERDLQAAAGDPCLRLPYWDWTNAAATGQVLNAAWFGTTGAGPTFDLTDGQFRNASGWRVLNGAGIPTTGGIARQRHATYVLPPAADVAALNAETVYDSANWDPTVPVGGGFRNHLEGFIAPAPPPPAPRSRLHNLVHVWMGGTMGVVPTAPNDPVFFVHHCNVDRLWALWQLAHPGAPYLPPAGAAPPAVPGHRAGDLMRPWDGVSDPATIATTGMLNTRALGYFYV